MTLGRHQSEGLLISIYDPNTGTDESGRGMGIDEHHLTGCNPGLGREKTVLRRLKAREVLLEGIDDFFGRCIHPGKPDTEDLFPKPAEPLERAYHLATVDI